MFLSLSAKGKNDWWLYLVGVLLIFTFYFLGQMPLTIVQLWKMQSNPSIGIQEITEFEKTMDFTVFGLDKNMGFLLLICIFVFAMIGLYIAIKYVHQKSIKDLITSFDNVRWDRIIFGFLGWMVLSLILEAVMYFINPQDYIFRFEASNFIILVLISIIFLPIQTSFEEIFFRGYIMQAIAFFSKNKVMSIFLSSIMFGLVHGTNPEVAKYGFWTMQFYYVVAGLFLALITVLDDGIELALGVHAATNVFGSTLFTYEGSVLKTDSLFLVSEIQPWVMIFGFIVSAAIFISFAHKKYKWPAFSSLKEPIQFQ